MLAIVDILGSFNVFVVVLFGFAGIGLWTTVRFVCDLFSRGLRRPRDHLPHYVSAGGQAAEDELSLALRRIEHLENQLEFTDGLIES
ncbi:MAG: hypothetical protein JSU87_02595 [Gemmatimonadota bacterium]|nr:MAG: hypothetical protein JSU87_02595 [Gemmatimonadota bacterium]